MVSTRATAAAQRRTNIADAVIELLASGGSRRVTHRAVDELAGLPQGSTSAYLRTRAGLLTAAAQRIADLDRQTLETSLVAGFSDGMPRPPAELIANVVDAWTTPPVAARQLARLELQLEARRTPELAALFSELRSGFQRAVLAYLQATTAESRMNADLHLVAGALTALIDGLVYDRLLHPSTAIPATRLQEAQEAVQALMATTNRSTPTTRQAT
ncbi:TetR/AcrR family transcriptional regulator [Nocardia pneumoniae]|uniref:TetR/AcrR family transcriptional regulator n=1 Tax=Nocardia pneumoniae TaxID=228601 RepID=UPI00031D6A9F|nr:TetR/AcrR family transcriptional regulator [Nocardia pneumoniae]